MSSVSSDSNTVININSISDIDNETNNIDNIDVQTEEVKDEILDNGDPTLTYSKLGKLEFFLKKVIFWRSGCSVVIQHN